MKTIADIKAIRGTMQKNIEDSTKIRVVVGMATCGIAAGARPVLEALSEEIEKKGLTDKVAVSQTGCIGLCQFEPIVDVFVPGQDKVTYIKMTAEKALEVIEKHIIGGEIVTDYSMAASGLKPAEGKEEVKALEDTNLYAKQVRVALRNCGVIDPENIDEYIGKGGYEALGKVLTEMTPDEVIETVLASGLRGRGGAGFPTGLKWKLCRPNQADQKFVCCNADEGDPGAFMDRSVLEGDPHSVLEAMAIAGYAIGSSQGYIYVRAEYPIAIERLQIAIDQAHEYGLLGKNIYGTDFNFDIELRLGAGAFVCGEETALMTSIEGKRGEPRPRPPFPAVKGLFQKPSILNNVETYANIAQIIVKGADWFAGMGTEKSKGTKVFALGGKITNTGLVEIPMGTPLRTIIDDIGGGVPNGKKFKAVQTGGPSGGCIPAEYIDIPVDYENLKSIGCIVGSGGMIVMDEDNCMVDIAKFFLEFTVDESCGKCTACRIGTRRMLETLTKITEGKATLDDLKKLEELCNYVVNNSLCALGQTAPNPVLSTIKFFKDEYMAHIVDKKCPAGVCKSLMQYVINADKCIGCGMCAKGCPADAIAPNAAGEIKEGKKKAYYVIDPEKCVKCGACIATCKFGAITKA